MSGAGGEGGGEVIFKPLASLSPVRLCLGSDTSTSSQTKGGLHLYSGKTVLKGVGCGGGAAHDFLLCSAAFC